MRYLYFISLTFILLLTGCSSKELQKPSVVSQDGVKAVVFTEEDRITYIKKFGDLNRFCASPDSDVQMVDRQGVTLGLSATGKGENIAEEDDDGALGLGGRSPMVLLVRELMYRACEVTSNLNTDEETTLEVYKLFLEKSIEFSKHIHGIGTKSTTAIPDAVKQQKTDDDSQDSDDEGYYDDYEDEESDDED